MSDWINTFAFGDNGGDCLFSLLPEIDVDPNNIKRRRYVRFFIIIWIPTYANLELTLTIFLTHVVSVQDWHGPVSTRSEAWR